MVETFYDAFVKVVADMAEADTVVLYKEDNGIFSPIKYFSLSKSDISPIPFTEEEDFLTSRVIREWRNFITEDERLLQDWPLPYSPDYVPSVFLAYPFKLAGSRALLCLDARNKGSFGEKQQRIVQEVLELLRSFQTTLTNLNKLKLYNLKLLAIEKMLKLFSTLTPIVAFEEMCSLMGFDTAGIFKYSDGIFKQVCIYRSKDSPAINFEVEPRSIFKVAIDKEESYIFDEEEGEFFPGHKAYGVVVPFNIKGFKGVFFATSSEKGFFGPGVLDLMNIVTSVMALFFYDETKEKSIVISPTETENMLKIMCNRVYKEPNKCLGVVLFTVKNVEKEYQRKGLWTVERELNEIVDRAKSLDPAFISKLGGTCVLVASLFDNEKAALKFKESFNTLISDIVDFKECETDLLVFPTEIEGTEELLKSISDKLAKSRKKGLLG